MMRTVHVAAAVIKSDRGILACRRADTQGDGGWEFPGGKVEEGESAEAACRREIAEELGCRLQLAWPYDVVETDYSDFHLVMDCFACTLEPGERPWPRPASTPSCAGWTATSSWTWAGCPPTARWPRAWA